ncbi:leucyl aminopeptidase [Candidatus Uhrbacteria bacterium]|nr:MAG: leucyl aminopeptidase [Candidatus Uhrbacteria bacterium]
MQIFIEKGLAPAKGFDLLVYPVLRKQSLAKLVDRSIAAFAEQEGFEGGAGEWLCVPMLNGEKSTKIAFLGMGDKRGIEEDSYRRLGGQLAKRIKEAKAKNVAVSWESVASLGVSGRDAMRAFMEGLRLGGYVFHAYHPEHKEKHRKNAAKSVGVFVDNTLIATAMQRGLEEAESLAAGVHLTRDLVNTPSMDMAPQHMADAADEVARLSKRIKIKHLDKSRMERMGMGAVLSVAQGSLHEPKGVHLIYTPSGKAKRKIVIVGKAVTFDSGGLSIKPADGMMTMKMDMAGGATVIGLFRALANIEVDAEVHGIFFAVENMPSGSAYRPGDVVTAMDGTTIEILNTDAEGRVTLADALAYAKTLEPDAIIDLATLTGACIVALGEEIAGAMGNDRKLVDKLIGYGKQTGEPLWELPMHPSYEEHVKSRIAHLKNIGSRGQAGAIAGAMFLKRFVGDTPWVHLDIAGPAYAERELRPDSPPGGTGFGVRLLMRYLQGL